MSERLNIDDDPHWQPCTAPGCVWHVYVLDGKPVTCGGHWNGEHWTECTLTSKGWCVCHEPQ